jgi:hypothetical protein
MGSFVGAREDQLHQSEPAQQHSLDSFSTGWRPSCAAARTASMPSKPNAARHMGKKRSRPQDSADTALTDCSVAILAKRNHQRPSSVSPSSSPYLRDASKDICSGVPVRRCMGAVCKQQAEETGISTPRRQVISREQVLQQMTAVGSATKGKAHNSSKIQQDSTNENYQEQQQDQEQACQQQQQEQQPSSSADTQQTAQPVYWDDTSYKPLNFGWMQPCRCAAAEPKLAHMLLCTWLRTPPPALLHALPYPHHCHPAYTDTMPCQSVGYTPIAQAYLISSRQLDHPP